MNIPCPIQIWSEKTPEAPALLVDGQCLSYRTFNTLVVAMVRGLSSAGVGRGDRIAAIAWNSPELMALFFAARRVGATLAPLNARLTAAEASSAPPSSLEPKLIVSDQALDPGLPLTLDLEQLAEVPRDVDFETPASPDYALP